MKIDIIVPVYNEQKTVATVVNTLLKSQLFHKVICVNDASTDSSLEILHTFGKKITLLSSHKNMGKGHALVKGIEAATAPILVFVDADLVGLQKRHLAAIIKPVVNEKAEAVIGLLDDISFKMFHETAALLSGQRVYRRKDLLSLMPKMKSKRFGIEVFLNEALKTKQTKLVFLKGLNHLLKHQKFSSPNAILTEAVKEVREVGREIYSVNSSKLEKQMKIWSKTRQLQLLRLLEEGLALPKNFVKRKKTTP